MRIPQLHEPTQRARRQIVATLTRPAYGRRPVIVLAVLVQLHHGGAGGGPDVDAGHEADGQVVRLRPVDKVEVEVVAELGRVEDFVGNLSNVPLFFMLEDLVSVWIAKSLERTWLKYLLKIVIQIKIKLVLI